MTERHVADAKAKGARVLTGGVRPRSVGSFYPPTVLVDVDHSMACMTEETFGPTLPIMMVSQCRRGDPAGQRQPVRVVRLGVLVTISSARKALQCNWIAVR